MCIPDLNVITTALDISSGIYKQAMNIKEKNDNANYRTQVAINNAKQAEKEALFQKQTGINKIREEKIEGMREAQKLIASNSASGFSLSSDTNNYALSDLNNNLESNSKEIEDLYNKKADSYYDKANSYLSEAKNISKSKNSMLLNLASIGLNKTRQVSDKWYKDSDERGEYELF